MRAASRFWTVSLLGMAAATAMTAPATRFVCGNLRITPYSNTLIRIEQKGPKGWEDRPTFHVLQRPAFATSKELQPGDIKIGSNTVRVSGRAQSLADVVVLDSSGKKLWAWDGKLPNSVALPAPSARPRAWWFADSPRITPPEWGLGPAPSGQENGDGWNLSNDAPDIYLFLPAGKPEVLRKEFLALTGPPELIPRYALGYMQSRYHPYSQQDVLDLIARYRKEDIPISLFVIDTDWRVGASHGYGENKKLFPDMKGLFRKMRELGVRSMFNDHPEPQAKTALDPKELGYRIDGLSQWLNAGLDVWWYDRNWMIGLVEPLPGLRKEVWGMKLYRDITLAARPDQRPLIMANVDGVDNGRHSRPGNVAAHRYSIQWTGDTGSTFAFLRAGVQNALVTGYESMLPYVSEDLGGHVGNPPAEQFVRWMQYGALSPTMRLHYTAGMKDREPWNYPKETLGIVRDYTQMRHALTPYLYTIARESYDTGLPLMRRCDFDSPSRKEAQANDQYLLGRNLLVAPILTGLEAKPIESAWWKGTVVAEYFDNTSHTGKPKVTRNETGIDFDWGMKAPARGLPTENYSTRFEGTLSIPANAPGGRLTVYTDDGVRIWVDGKKVLDEWRGQVASFELPGKFEAGSSYAIRIEHHQLGGGALLQLRWVSSGVDPRQSRQVWLPPGQWFNLWTGATQAGPKSVTAQAELHETPMWVRAGSILPLIEVSHQPLDAAIDPTVLDIYPDAKGRAEGTWYADDGNSRKYETGSGRWTTVRYEGNQDGSALLSVSARGIYPAKDSTMTIRIHGPKGKPTKIGGAIVHDGQPMPVLRPSTVEKSITIKVSGKTLTNGGRIILEN